LHIPSCNGGAAGCPDRVNEWIVGALESLPSILFLALWRGGADPETSGWIGSGLAAALLVGVPAGDAG